MTSRNRRDHGGAKSWEFQHANFLREDQSAAVEIRRRSAADTEAVRSEGETMRLSVASLRNQLAAARKQLAAARASLDASEAARQAAVRGQRDAERRMDAMRSRYEGGAGWAPSSAATDEDQRAVGLGSETPVAADTYDGEVRLEGSRKRLRMSPAVSAELPASSRPARIHIKAEPTDDDEEDNEAVVAPTPSGSSGFGGFASRRSPSSALAGAFSGLKLSQQPTLSAMVLPSTEPPLAGPEPDAVEIASALFPHRLRSEQSAFGIPAQADDIAALASPCPPGMTPSAGAAPYGFGVDTPRAVPGLTRVTSSQDPPAPSLFLRPSLSRVGSEGSVGSAGSFGAVAPPLEPPMLARSSSLDTVDPWGPSDTPADFFGSHRPLSSADAAAAAADANEDSSSSSWALPTVTSAAPSSSASSRPDPADVISAILPQLAYHTRLGTSASAVSMAMLLAQARASVPAADQHRVHELVVAAIAGSRIRHGARAIGAATA